MPYISAREHRRWLFAQRGRAPYEVANDPTRPVGLVFTNALVVWFDRAVETYRAADSHTPHPDTYMRDRMPADTEAVREAHWRVKHIGECYITKEGAPELTFRRVGYSYSVDMSPEWRRWRAEYAAALRRYESAALDRVLHANAVERAERYASMPFNRGDGKGIDWDAFEFEHATQPVGGMDTVIESLGQVAKAIRNAPVTYNEATIPYEVVCDYYEKTAENLQPVHDAIAAVAGECKATLSYFAEDVLMVTYAGAQVTSPLHGIWHLADRLSGKKTVNPLLADLSRLEKLLSKLAKHADAPRASVIHDGRLMWTDGFYIILAPAGLATSCEGAEAAAPPQWFADYMLGLTTPKVWTKSTIAKLPGLFSDKVAEVLGKITGAKNVTYAEVRDKGEYLLNWVRCNGFDIILRSHK